MSDDSKVSAEVNGSEPFAEARGSEWSRRYVCSGCGSKGRVSKAKRGPRITCYLCKLEQPARRADATSPNNQAERLPAKNL